MSAKKTPAELRIESLDARLAETTVNLGYALECIRELVQLAETAGHDKAVVVKVARRFLADMEGAK